MTSLGRTSDRRRVALALLVPLLLTGAAYWRTLDAAFVFDDQHVVEQNGSIKSFGALLSRPGLLSPSSRAVTDLTLALNYRAGRLDPFGYHAVNLAIHLAVVLLLWRLARALLRRAEIPHAEVAAVAVAGLFALHPLQSQAVAYVAQRAEILAALLTLAGLDLLFAAQRAALPRSRLLLRGAAFGLMLLAVYAKSIAVTAPVLWLLLTWAFPDGEGDPRPRPLGRSALVALPFVAMSAVVAALVLGGFSGSAEAGWAIPGLSVSEYLFTQAHVVWTYVRMLALPFGQSIDHDFPIQRQLDGTTALALLGLLAAVAGAAVLLAMRPRPAASWRALRTFAAGVLWFAIALAPTSSVVPVVDVMMEHRVYLASFGLLLGVGALAATAVDWAGPRALRPALFALGAAWCVEAAALYQRNAVWESPLALWSDAAEKAPRKVRPIANVGFALDRAGDLDGAIRAYRRALALPPDRVTRPQDIVRNLGAALARTGRIEEAAAAFGQALALQPFDASLLTNLAICKLELKDAAGAEAAARRALEIDPRLGSAHNTLGEVLLAGGDAKGALASFLRGAELDPDVAVRHFNVAVAAERLGRIDEACAAALRVSAAVRSDFDRQLLAELDAGLACPGRLPPPPAPPTPTSEPRR